MAVLKVQNPYTIKFGQCSCDGPRELQDPKSPKLLWPKISEPQQGPAERDHVKNIKNRQKCPKYFRHFSRRAKNVKNRQKVSKIFSTLFDNFRAAPVFRPLLGGSDKSSSKVGFGGFQEIGQKVGPRVGFPLRVYSKTLLLDLLFDIFLEIPRNLLLSYFWPTFFSRDFGSCGSRAPLLQYSPKAKKMKKKKTKFLGRTLQAVP